MKLDKAFSEDIEINITAQEADKLFVEGDIKSKFNFQCPDENCDAPVTCANLDRPKYKRKRDPYYKVVGKHRPKCDLVKNIDTQRKSTSTSIDIYSNEDEYVDNAIRLNLQPPSTKRSESIDNTQGSDDTNIRARPSNSPESGKRKIQRSKTLSSLIDAYRADETHIVQLPEIGLIDIKYFFVEINGQDLSDLEDEYRIYYGKAWFNKKENGYSIVFDKKLISGDVVKRPSSYMPIDKLEESGFRRFNANILEKISDGKPKIVFLLSETGPRLRDGYINIWCEGPEYLEYR